jgi:hypothetical protein
MNGCCWRGDGGQGQEDPEDPEASAFGFASTNKEIAVSKDGSAVVGTRGRGPWGCDNMSSSLPCLAFRV